MNAHQRRKARRARERRILRTLRMYRSTMKTLYGAAGALQTVTGRLSSSKPNFRPHRIPYPRTEEGGRLREALRRGQRLVREGLEE